MLIHSLGFSLQVLTNPLKRKRPPCPHQKYAVKLLRALNIPNDQTNQKYSPQDGNVKCLIVLWYEHWFDNICRSLME